MNGSTDFTRTVLVELDQRDVAAEFFGPVPGTVAGDNNLVAILSREHGAGVEPHAERRGVRAHQRDRRYVVLAVVAPAELDVGDIALMAIRLAEIQAELGDAVELVVGQVLRQPVAAVVGEVELVRLRIPVEADRVADAEGDLFGAGAVEIHAAQLAMILIMQHVVAGLTDFEIELVVRADGQELPAMRLVLGQVLVDDDRLRRLVDLVFDIVDLGDLRQLGDVERAVLVGHAVRAIEAGHQHMDLAFAVFVGDGIDLVLQARADEHRALLIERHRARIGHAAGIDLDVEALRGFQLVERQLVLGGGERWRRHRRQFCRGRVVVRTSDQRRAGRQCGCGRSSRRWSGRRSRSRRGSRSGRLRGRFLLLLGQRCGG